MAVQPDGKGNRAARRKLFWTPFLGCLLIATLLWFTSTMNERFTGRIHVVLNSSEVGSSRGIMDSVLEANVEATGWKLLALKTGLHSNVLHLETEELKAKKTLSSADLNRAVATLLGRGDRVLSTNPESVEFSYRDRISKKVPLKPMLKLEIKEGFDIYGDVEVFPKEVVIEGPRDKVADIDFVYTDTLQLKDIKDNIEAEVGVHYKDVKLSVRKVSIRATVSQLTEIRVEKTIDLSGYEPRKLTALPERATLTLAIPVKATQVDQILEKIVVVVDMPKAGGKGASTELNQKLIVKGLENGARVLRIEPEWVTILEELQ